MLFEFFWAGSLRSKSIQTVLGTTIVSVRLTVPFFRFALPIQDDVCLVMEGDSCIARRPNRPNTRVNAHEEACIYASAVEGSQKLDKFARPPSAETTSREAHALLQTGLDRPLRTNGGYTLSTSPWTSAAQMPGLFDSLITVRSPPRRERSFQSCKGVSGIDTATQPHLLQLRKEEREEAVDMETSEKGRLGRLPKTRPANRGMVAIVG